MFEKILIANRGEIACRIMRTAKRLNVKTVAVYADADATSLHVQMADEAVHIGASPPRESYLRGDVILKAAADTGAQAVHPGYGFLSENADFARACGQAGIRFIGPSPEAIEAMGRKDAALERMLEAGVPILPGFRSEDATDEDLAQAANNLGLPVLVKPSAGGGGKGMQVVRAGDDLVAVLASSRREALAAFGDGVLLLERYLERPRHVEVQIFADRSGNAVYLLDRDCSIQRRYQKVIEEAPAPGLSADLRERMGQAAVAAARAINYEGAGTIEFLLDTNSDGVDTPPFYFMEMNTRLQVEHPVTEMVLGEDLVEWQLRIACGEPLALTQEQVQANGHAIEARIYAEDPNRDFLPASGRISRFLMPEPAPHLRIDRGVSEGDQVSIHYDPMIAKLIVHGSDREVARQRLCHALENTLVAGLPTNLGLLGAVAANGAFKGGDLATSFMTEQHGALATTAEQEAESAVLAALWCVLNWHQAPNDTFAARRDPGSPWHTLHGFRLNLPWRTTVRLSDHEQRDFDIAVSDDVDRGQGESSGFVITHGETQIRATGRLVGDRLIAQLDGRRRDCLAALAGRELYLVNGSHRERWTIPDSNARTELERGAGQGRLTAPMPGKILDVLVSKGDRVEESQPLLVLEAMKMEHRITAPFAGVVSDLHFSQGDLVDEGAELISIAPPSD